MKDISPLWPAKEPFLAPAAVTGDERQLAEALVIIAMSVRDDDGLRCYNKLPINVALMMARVLLNQSEIDTLAIFEKAVDQKAFSHLMGW